MFGRKKITAEQEADGLWLDGNDKSFAENRKMPPLNTTTKSHTDVSRMTPAIREHYENFKLKTKDDELVMA